MLLSWFKKWLGHSKPITQVTSTAPTTQEPLTREGSFHEAYKIWLASPRPGQWLERLRCAFNVYRAELDPQDDGVDFMCFQASRGFVLYLQNEEMIKNEGAFIMDLLRDKVLDEGYRLAHSDRLHRGSCLLEKHYLKPPINRDFERPAPQLYGNITIELQCRHQCEVNLKLVATSYEDRSYAPALPFSRLLESLTA